MANIDTKTIIQYLTVLELPLDKPINQEIVKTQYRKLVKVFHPDAHQEIYSDGTKFVLLKTAYDFLYANVELVNQLIASNFQTPGSTPRNYEAEFQEALRRAAMAKALREAAEQTEKEEQSRRESAERKAKRERERKEAAEREAASSRQRTAQLENAIKAEEAKREALRKAAEKKKSEEAAAETARLAKRDEEIRELRKQYVAFLDDTRQQYNPVDYDEKSVRMFEDICRHFKEKQNLIFKQADFDKYTARFIRELNSIRTKKQKKKIKIAALIAGCLAVFVAISIPISITIKTNADRTQKAERYNAAAVLMSVGSYQEAMEYYESLGDYGDSPNKYKVCKGLAELEAAIDTQSESGVVSGIKSIVSGGESVYVTYLSSNGHSIKRKLRGNDDDDTYSEVISSIDFSLYTPKENIGYTFKNWFATYVDYSDKVTLSLDSNWELNQYTITYYLDGGTNSSNNPVSYSVESSDIVLSAASKDHHHFIGWFDSADGKNQITEIPHGSSGNITLYAKYAIFTYEVNFYNWDYTKLYTATVKHGSAAEYPYENPTKPADQQYTYSFTGWNKSLLNITENTDFVAEYSNTINQYTVTFKNWDGEILDTCTVDYGETAFYSGKTPTKPNSQDDRHYYTHSGWNKSLENVQNSYEVQATFDEHDRFLASFYNNGELVYSIMTNENEVPLFEGNTPTKDADQQYHYTFKDWEPTLGAITEDTEYDATFTGELNKYTVTFKNYDGTVLGADTVDYGTPATYSGETPTRNKDQQYTYAFNGWSIPLDSITENVDAFAQYDTTLNKYTVTFKNYDGTVLGTDTVDYGSVASYDGETPTKPKDQQYTYAFSGWDISLNNITSDREAIAQFANTLNKYTVTFKNYDGTVLGADTVDYGTSASFSGATPTKPDVEGDCGYKFVGWNLSLSNVTYDYEVIAQFEIYLKHATFSLDDSGNGYALNTYSGTSSYVHIPDSFNGKPITEISSYALQDTEYVEIIDVPDSVKRLNDSCFPWNLNIKRINISANSQLTTVGSYVVGINCFTFHSYKYLDGAENERALDIWQCNIVFPKATTFSNKSLMCFQQGSNYGIVFYEDDGYFRSALGTSTEVKSFWVLNHLGQQAYPKSYEVNSFCYEESTNMQKEKLILTKFKGYDLVHDSTECCDNLSA